MILLTIFRWGMMGSKNKLITGGPHPVPYKAICCWDIPYIGLKKLPYFFGTSNSFTSSKFGGTVAGSDHLPGWWLRSSARRMVWICNQIWSRLGQGSILSIYGWHLWHLRHD